MTRLLHDRYYAYAPDHAWDLATGESVPMAQTAMAQPPLSPVAETLLEVLDNGRDGEPRWVVVETTAGQSSVAVARRAAEQARARGLVPISVDVYLRLRTLLDEELRHRTLMLILPPGSSLQPAREALLYAASVSPRPHVLVSFRSGRPLVLKTGAHVVREARAVYGAATSPHPTLKAAPEDVLRLTARAARWVELCGSGRHAAAERLLRETAGSLLRRRAFAAAATLLVALGRLVLERGRAGDADTVFGEAASHALSAQEESGSAIARVWQAAAKTDAGQLTAAESLCRAAIVSGALAGADRARGEAALARTLLWQGRTAEAAARNLRVDADDPELVAFVDSTSIRVLIADGDLFTAGQRARQLLMCAEASRHPIVRVIALSSHLRVLLEAGDLVLGEQCLGEIRRAARAARTPLRLVRARVLWVDALRRAGRTRAAERELRDLRRLRGATPPLLRAAIDGRLRGDVRSVDRERVSLGAPAAAVRMIEMARDEGEDRDAVRKVIAFAARSLHTSRIDLCSSDAGPDSTILSVGSGLATGLGSRILDAGIAIDMCASGAGGELGVPVRIGSRLVAAVVARWPVDRVPPASARELLELTAAVSAPRIDAMRVTAREVASASVAIPEPRVL